MKKSIQYRKGPKDLVDNIYIKILVIYITILGIIWTYRKPCCSLPMYMHMQLSISVLYIIHVKVGNMEQIPLGIHNSLYICFALSTYFNLDLVG